ncbi:MAG: hypothetical protein P4L41_15120 [Flavipsychrobacter sp.]|nr:hypothetical protein [Flavipsychrobacter sp.]
MNQLRSLFVLAAICTVAFGCNKGTSPIADNTPTATTTVLWNKIASTRTYTGTYTDIAGAWGQPPLLDTTFPISGNITITKVNDSTIQVIPDSSLNRYVTNYTVNPLLLLDKSNVSITYATFATVYPQCTAYYYYQNDSIAYTYNWHQMGYVRAATIGAKSIR